jgi:hypothetical protein
MVLHARYAGLTSAVRTTEVTVVLFNSVADDLASTALAARSERMYRALETVENMLGATDCDVHGFVVLVTADLALSHS